jgi:hypothetical protein
VTIVVLLGLVEDTALLPPATIDGVPVTIGINDETCVPDTVEDASLAAAEEAS